jgi:hypothetical protein
LLVPDETDREAWAKCPECRSFFQLKQAAAREVPAVLLVEPDAEAIDDRSATTLAGISAASTLSDPDDLLQLSDSEELESATLMEEPKAGETLEAAAQRIDEWFRSAKTVPDAPPIVSDNVTFISDPDEPDVVPSSDIPIGATLDLGSVPPDELAGDIDFQLEDPLESPQPAAWEDTQHMNQLLDDIDGPNGGNRERDETSINPFSDQVSPEFSTSKAAPSRRKRSPVRALLMIVIAGIVGSGLGYYALLWLRGPSGDFLDLAKYLPDAVKPSSLQATAPVRIAANPPVNQPAAEAAVEATESMPETPPVSADDTAEVQAGYTTTDEQAAESPPPVGDRYNVAQEASEPATEEPAALEEPPAAALTAENETPEVVQIANAPSFNTDDLRAALETAKAAQPKLVTGNFADNKETGQAKGYGYSMLADLAQKASFVDSAASPDQANPLQQESDELFRQTLADPHTRSEVTKILPKWIGSPNRKHGGVFFAGIIARGENAGSVVECKVELEDGQSITILAPAAAADQLQLASQPTAIVGWILDRPAELVSGYTGSAPQAVWASKIIPLQ